MLAAVQQNGRALEYASEELRADRELVLAAVRQDGLALEVAEARLEVAEARLEAAEARLEVVKPYTQLEVVNRTVYSRLPVSEGG